MRLHYLEAINFRIKLPSFLRAFAIASGALLLFLFFSLDSFPQVFSSKLFYWQLNFSFSLFIGLLFGDIAFTEIRSLLKRIIKGMQFTSSQAKEFEIEELQRLASQKSHLLALPIIVFGLIFGLGQASQLQTYLGTQGFSLAYLFSVVILLCFVMIDLLGATGYWIMYCYYRLYLKLLALSEFDYSRVNLDILQEGRDSIRKLSVLLFFIIMSLIPSILIVANQLELRMRIWLVVLGAFFPFAMLLLSYFVPSHFLVKLLEKVRTAKQEKIEQKILQLEKKFFEAIKVGNKKADSKMPQAILKELNALRGEIAYLERKSIGISTANLLEVFSVSLLSPLITAIFQKYFGA